jgi:hypothetical protein
LVNSRVPPLSPGRAREPVAKRLEAIEIEIDKAAAELWKITAAELAEIKFSLADLQ